MCNILLLSQVWEVTRSKGKHMPSGGTLIVGREQDCVGGCFDSAPGAVLACRQKAVPLTFPQC